MTAKLILFYMNLARMLMGRIESCMPLLVLHIIGYIHPGTVQAMKAMTQARPMTLNHHSRDSDCLWRLGLKPYAA